MKIIKLQAENIKKLKAIEIIPDSNLVQITGANAQGKTSVLDSIWYALGGKDAIGPNPIRNNEDAANIKIEFDDFIVTRTFKNKDGELKTSLFIESKDGKTYKKPQTMLDSIVGKLSFDPLSFGNLNKKDQFDLLCDLCNIDYDFDCAETESKACYDERRIVNRELKEIEAEGKNIVIDEEAETTRIDAQELLVKIRDATEFNAAQFQKDRDISQLREFNTRFTKELEDKKKELEERKAEVSKEIAINTKRIGELADSREALKDIEDLDMELASIQQTNTNADKFDRKEVLREKFLKKKDQVDRLTKDMQQIANDKSSALNQAKMPIDGLIIADGEVWYNGVQFEQLSGAEKLKVSLSIAAAANPKIKVIRITDGSLLDKKAMAELLAFANESNFQIWVERVDESGKIGICIEDGIVKKK